MKYILTLVFLTVISLNSYSQKSTACYDEWYSTFEKHGCTAVKDGINEVIITLRKDSNCESYLGKVTVKNGLMVRGSLLVLMEDGTYVRSNRSLSPKFSNNPDAPGVFSIFDGMTTTFLTTHDEMVNIFFYKNLNKTERKYKKAPSPAEVGIQ